MSEPAAPVVGQVGQVGPVGVVGLGNMGGGIARNLHRAGMTLHAWDTDAQARTRLAALPGTVISEPGAMAAACEVIIFVVPATPEIAASLDGEDGVLAHARDGLVVYDFTTSDPRHTR
jgi:3-hydroxyisobutyrate dehydrogenase